VQKRRSVQRRHERGVQPLEHLSQAKGHGRREQQRRRPQGQQHERSARVGHEPARAHVAPARERAPALEQHGRERARERAQRIEQQVEVGGHALRQVNLQKLHAKRQQRPRERGEQKRPARAHARAQQCECEQKTQRGIAEHVGEEVKPRPVRWRQRRQQENPGRDPLCAPAAEGKQARKNDQRDVEQRQRPGGGLVHGH
jgi:hypothetical protein